MQLESQLRSSAALDAMTGFLTTDAFRRRLSAEARQRRRDRQPVSLVRIGLDGLVAVQRDHGDGVGDEVVCHASGVIRAAVRAGDLVCRSGADTFDLLLSETDGSEARACAERVLLELGVAEVGELRTIAASAGIAGSADGVDAVALPTSAAQALAEARAAGGGRVVVAGTQRGLEDSAADLFQRDAVEVLMLALLERDRYTGEHSESVVDMAAAVARTLGRTETEIEQVRSAALLHDVGKVGIPDAILNKPGPLTDEEREVMAEHTLIGERILSGIPGFAPIAAIVRHEHERWDGGGYPDGLAGEAIPLGSRIILACDAYHAMTSDRPYRARMSHADAIKEIAANVGTQFDPDVTSALIGHLYGQPQEAETAPDPGDRVAS